MSINPRRALELFRYFPLTTALSLIVSDGVKALFDRHAGLTYSQTAEDVLLRCMIDSTLPGFYVDVGCNHPVKGSNTFSFYKRGWRGLVVDGNAKLLKVFRKVRPRDTAIAAIVSDQVREMSFTLCHSRPELSCVSDEFEERWMRNSDEKEKVHVQSVTLNSLFLDHSVPNRFDLLSIDCEGHDFEVLTSFSLNEFRPRVVVVEMHDFDVTGVIHCPVKDYLVGNGYRLAAYTTMNGIFVDER